MTCTIRDATPSDLTRAAALYGREVRNGTATFELEPPTAEEMGRRFAAVQRHDLPWLVAEVDGSFAGWGEAGRARSGGRKVGGVTQATQQSMAFIALSWAGDGVSAPWWSIVASWQGGDEGASVPALAGTAPVISTARAPSSIIRA